MEKITLIRFSVIILAMLSCGFTAFSQNSWDETFTALQTAQNEGQMELANDLLPKALAQAEETYGKKHAAYIYTLHLGVKLALQTQALEQGLKLANEELELIKTVEFEDQQSFYTILLNYLYQINLQLDNSTEATQFAKEYMDMLSQQQSGTLNHALSIYEYASLLYQNQSSEALPYFEKALAALNNHINQAGSQYLNSLFYVASLLMEENKSARAAEYFDKVLGITQDNNLQNSPLWKNSAYQRALIYQENNQNERAISFYEILKLQLENDGETDDDLYNSTKNNLGVLYQKTGNASKGESLLALGGNDLRSQLNSAALAFNKGDYATALELYTLANNSFIKENEADTLESAKILAQKALVYQQLGQLNEALALLLTIDKSLLSNIPEFKEEKALTYKNTGDIFLEMADYDSAELYLNKALLQFSTNSNFKPEIEIQIRNSLGVLAQNRSQLNQAVQYFRDNLKLIEKSLGNQSLEYANTLNNLGSVSLENSDYKQAETYFLNARTIFKQLYGENHENNARSFENLGLLAQSRSQLKKADSLYQLAEVVYESSLGKDHPALLNIYSKRALVQLSQANYPLSEQYFRKAINLSKSIFGQESAAYADALSGMGLFYQSTGNLVEAKKNLNTAIAIYTQKLGKLHPSYITSIENLSSIYQGEGNLEAALPLLQEALEMDSIVYGINHPKYATTLHNLASLYLSKGDLEKAEVFYEKSLTIDKEVFGTETPTYAGTQYNLAVLYQRQNRLRQADSLFSQVAQLREKVLGVNHPDYIFTLYGWGILKQLENEIDTAYVLFNEAVSSYLFLFKEYFPSMSEDEKAAFYHKVNPVFEAYKDFAVENHEKIPHLVQDLFDLQLTTKAMLLNASAKMRTRILNSGDETLISLFTDWQNLKEKAIQYYSYTKEELALQQIDLAHVESEINLMEKELSIQSTLFASGFGADSVNWQMLKASLEPNTGVVEILRIKKSLKNDSIIYVGLILTDTMDEPKISILQEGKTIEQKYFYAYQNLVKFKLMDKISYENLWQWVDKDIPEGLSKLYVSPDGIYNKININTLYSENLDQYLLEKENIRLITSARDLIQNKNRKDNAFKLIPSGNDMHGSEQLAFQPRIVLLGSPDFSLGMSSEFELTSENTGLMRAFSGGIPPLPGTKVEINAIDSLAKISNWTIQKYMGAEANEIVVDTMSSPNILHIATHGFFKVYDNDQKVAGMENQNNEENPLLRSGLMLAGASIGLGGGLPYENSFEDGLLTAYETMNLNLDQTDLVVLSACETGLGDVKNGEGVYGLQRAFLVAGARNLIMSLWTVNDYTTQLLMTEFYKRWTGGEDKFTAFRNAQLKIKEQFPQPYYWAAFTIIGE